MARLLPISLLACFLLLPAPRASRGGDSGAASTAGIIIVDPVDVSALQAQLRTATGAGAEIVDVPGVGQTVYFHLRFRVEGPGATVAVAVEARLDGEVYCSTEADVPVDGTYLAYCNDEWTATSGSHRLDWDVSLVDVLESNTSNNSAVRFWKTAAGSNLAAVRAFLRTAANGGDEVAAPSVGEEVFFHLQRSDVDLPTNATFVARAELDGEVYCQDTFTAQDGTVNAWCLSGWTATQGAHVLSWTLDVDDRIAEIDEDDNEASTDWLSLLEPTATPPASPTQTAAGTSTAVDTPTRTATIAAPTATRPPDSTPTAVDEEPSPTYGPRRAPPVVGDCDGDRKVAINELIRGVRIALKTATLASCSVFDVDRSFSVSIAELIRAVNVALRGVSTGPFLPDVFLQVVPGALLLPEGSSTGELRVEAFESDGDPIAIESLDIEWLSSDPDLVRVDFDSADPSEATVTVLDQVCNAIVVARLRDQPLIVSPPVNVMRAVLHPEAVIVPDQMVVFPPPNLPEGVDPSSFDLPGHVAASVSGVGEGSFGGFSESEIAAYLEVTDELDMRYPIVLRGPAPEIGQRLVGGGGAPIAGIVVDHEQRGGFCLVQMEIAPPQELFEELDASVSAEELLDDGLLLPPDTSSWEDDGDFVADADAATSGILTFEVGPFECRPPTSGSVRPTLTQSPAPSSTYFGPIWDGNLRISGSGVERLFFKIGFLARAFFSPEIRLTPGVTVTYTCDLKRRHRIRRIFPLNGALALVLAPYLEGFPSLGFNLDLSGGPTLRFGFRLGFDHSYWTGGTYTSEQGWSPLCETWDECSRTNQEAELVFDAEVGPQISVAGTVGGYGVAEAGVIGLGAFLAVLERIPLGPLLQGAVDSIEEKAQLRLLRARIGPELSWRWHNGRRTAFIEASESAANGIVGGDLGITLDSINKYLRKVFNFFDVLSIPLVDLDLFHFAEPYRILTEETLTVNGKRVGSGDPPVEVGQRQSVPVVSTVARDFINLTLIELFLTRISPHEEFPYTGELLLDGEVIAMLSPSDDFALTGSFEATRALCERAEADGGSLEVKVLAYNRMFRLIPTANYAGSFRFACTDNRAPVVDAGPDQQIDEGQSALLNGTVMDDGLPIPPGVTVATWSGSGPGAVAFADRRELRTTATFAAPGVYTLTLLADDGELSSSDTLEVTVRALGDRTPPDLSVDPCGGVAAPGETIRISVLASDDVAMDLIEASVPAGVSSPRVQTSPCPPTTAPCSKSFDFELADPLPPGPFDVDVEAMDEAGNRTSRSCTYRRPGGGEISFTLRKITDTDAIAPGTDGTFGSLAPRFALGRDGIVFQATNNLGNFGGIGLYGDRGFGVEVIADSETRLPDPFAGSPGCTFSSIFQFAVDDDVLAFETGGTCFSSFDHVFIADLPSLVPRTPTGISGYSMRNFGLDPTDTPELRLGGEIFFVGLSGQRVGLAMTLPTIGDLDEDSPALYVFDRDQPSQPPAGPAERVVDAFTPMPGTADTFFEIRDVSFENDRFVFRGRGPGSLQDRWDGIYTASTGGQVTVVADKNTPIPGGTGTFTEFCATAVDGDEVAFEGRGEGGQRGVYLARGGDIERIADRTTLVPGRGDEFATFQCDLALDGGRLVFGGSHSISGVRGGLFVHQDGVLSKLLERGDMLDGETIFQLSIGADSDKALRGDRLGFTVTFDGPAPRRSALYVATIESD